MKNYLKVDDRNRVLIMDRTFDKNRQIVGSKEYDLLQRAMQDHPQYSVVLRHIKTNSDKRKYKHLTYNYMREYIVRHPNAEKRMEEFEEMTLRARCHVIKYPKVKEWFLAAYPEIDDFTPEDYKKECEGQELSGNRFEVLVEGVKDEPCAA
jgi:uncharacterized protein YydD (DUF2326 family)